MNPEFKCEMCEGIFEKEWSDEESQAEMEENFPGLTKENAAQVCDDCYSKIMNIPS